MKLILLQTLLLQIISIYTYKVINKKFEVITDYSTNSGIINETIHYEMTRKDLTRNNVLQIRKIVPNKVNNFTNFTVKLIDQQENKSEKNLKQNKIENFNFVELLGFGLRINNPNDPHLDYKMLIIELKLIDHHLLNKNMKINLNLMISYSGENIFQFDEHTKEKRLNLQISSDSLVKDIMADFDIFIKNSEQISYKNFDLHNTQMKEFGYLDRRGYKLLRVFNETFVDEQKGIFSENNFNEKIYKILFSKKIYKNKENYIKMRIISNEQLEKYENNKEDEKVIVDVSTLNTGNSRDKSNLNSIIVNSNSNEKKINLVKDDINNTTINSYKFIRNEPKLIIPVDNSLLSKIRKRLELIRSDSYENFGMMLLLFLILLISLFLWRNFQCKIYSFKIIFKY